MEKRPYILVTNDDGVYAPGIKHLCKILTKIADVVVVAPANEQSAVGLSITVRHPLRIEKVHWIGSENPPVWGINGTPADCVKLALSVILPTSPQLIVSGINRGSNAGRNVLYSGTVAGVIEGVLHDIPGIAFSMADYFNPCYENADKYVCNIVDYMLKNPFSTGTLLNVNFPEHAEKSIKGVRLTKQGKSYWAENPEQRVQPAEGSHYYWLGAKLAQFEEDPDCDVSLLKEGFVTVVPLHMSDLTNHSAVVQKKDFFESSVNARNERN